MREISGVITKGIGGFYYVKTELGLIECKPRGIFRKDGQTPLVGDKAHISVTDEQNLTGVIEKIYERSNELVRPPVANVTQIAIVFASLPKPDLQIIDKLIAFGEYLHLKILICINKTDLEYDESIADIYKKAQFNVLELSVTDKVNIDALMDELDGNITVFAGNSGVGKSSLANEVLGREQFEIGQISEKIGRGKQTTRHCELVPCGGRSSVSTGYVIDTPGFSSFEVLNIPLTELAGCFREFTPFLGDCKFNDCAHITAGDAESLCGCAIVSAVASGGIARSRFESYCSMYNKLKSVKEW